MRICVVSGLLIVGVAIGACGDVGPNAPVNVETGVLGRTPIVSVLGCPSGADCKYAKDMGGLDYDTSVFSKNCVQESCGTQDASLETIVVDSAGGLDFAVYTCPWGTGSTPSDSSCFECTADCGNPAPLGGQFAAVLAGGVGGSNCRAMLCRPGYKRHPSIPWGYLPFCTRDWPTVSASVVESQFVGIEWGAIVGTDTVFVERELSGSVGTWERWYTGAVSPYVDGSTLVTGQVLSAPPPSGAWVGYRLHAKNRAGSEYSQAFYFVLDTSDPGGPPS